MTLMTYELIVSTIKYLCPGSNQIHTFSVLNQGTKDLLENHSTPCNWSHLQIHDLGHSLIKTYSLGTWHHARQKVNNTVGSLAPRELDGNRKVRNRKAYGMSSD